jgi:biopolymer transport protein ExbD
MAFKREKEAKQSIELLSLIDMIFILLVFFLVTTFAGMGPGDEQALMIPTPKNRPGHAQLFIQIKNSGEFFWLDDRAQEAVNQLMLQFSLYPANMKNRMVWEQLESRFTFQSVDFQRRLTDFVRSSKAKPNRDYYIIIRCPDDVPYSAVMRIISILSAAENIKYGCIGGEMSDIRNARVTTGVYKGRTVLKLDFK